MVQKCEWKRRIHGGLWMKWGVGAVQVASTFSSLIHVRVVMVEGRMEWMMVEEKRITYVSSVRIYYINLQAGDHGPIRKTTVAK